MQIKGSVGQSPRINPITNSLLRYLYEIQSVCEVLEKEIKSGLNIEEVWRARLSTIEKVMSLLKMLW